MLNSKADEDFILNFFISKGLVPMRYSDGEKRTLGKTPDFKVYKDDRILFFCEVKSLFDSNTQSPRQDPAYSKIVNKIHEAAAQLESVNTDRKYPNVLAFVDHQLGTAAGDLASVLEGYYHSEDGEKHQIKNYFGEEKFIIDLFIWMENEPKLFFVTSSPFVNHLSSVFDIEFSKINVRPK